MAKNIVIDFVNLKVSDKSFFYMKILSDNIINIRVDNDNIFYGTLKEIKNTDEIDNSLYYFIRYIKLYFKDIETFQESVSENGVTHYINIIKIHDMKSIYVNDIESIDITTMSNVVLSELPYEILTLKINKDNIHEMYYILGSRKLTFILLNIYNTNYIIKEYSQYIDWEIISCQPDISNENLQLHSDKINMMYIKLLNYDLSNINFKKSKMDEYYEKLKEIEKKITDRDSIDIDNVNSVLNNSFKSRYQYLIDEIVKNK